MKKIPVWIFLIPSCFSIINMSMILLSYHLKSSDITILVLFICKIIIALTLGILGCKWFYIEAKKKLSRIFLAISCLLSFELFIFVIGVGLCVIWFISLLLGLLGFDTFPHQN